MTCGSSFEDKRSRSEGKCHTRHPSQDFLLGPPTGLSQLQSGIEKMGLGSTFSLLLFLSFYFVLLSCALTISLFTRYCFICMQNYFFYSYVLFSFLLISDVPDQNHEPNAAHNRSEDLTTMSSALCPSTSTSPENVLPSCSITSHLTDLSQLKLHANPKDGKQSRYTADSFKIDGQVQLANGETSEGDPFSGIDPLWPLKRK